MGGDTHVVHDAAVRLHYLAAVRPFDRAGPVGAGDSLKEAVLLERLVEIQHRLDRRVEPRQQLVADDQEAGLLPDLLECLLDRLLGRVIDIVGFKFFPDPGDVGVF